MITTSSTEKMLRNEAVNEGYVKIKRKGQSRNAQDLTSCCLIR